LDQRGRALRSLLAQSDPDWFAVAVASGFVPNLPLEARYFSVRGRADASKVEVLNDALNHLHLAASTGDMDCEWVAVLDDHDTVSPEFVARCKEVEEVADVIIFRSHYAREVVLPHPLYPALVPEEIGLGIVFRRAFAEHAALRFEPVGDPLSYFLVQAEKSGARVLLHPAISYFEKDTAPRG
jgi:hypothetical protein